MAFTTVAQVQAAVARRVRDPNVITHGDVMLAVLSDCQRLVNAALGSVVADDTLTLVHRQVLYTYAEVAADVVRVVKVTSDAGRVLQQVDWRQLVNADPHWLHAVAEEPRYWFAVGHNLLGIYPSPPGTGRTATVRYVQDLADLGSGDTLDIPSAHANMMIDMAEEVLLLRARLFPSLAGADEALTRHTDSKLMP